MSSFEWGRRVLVAALVAAGVLAGVGVSLATAASDGSSTVAQKCPPEDPRPCGG